MTRASTRPRRGWSNALGRWAIDSMRGIRGRAARRARRAAAAGLLRRRTRSLRSRWPSSVLPSSVAGVLELADGETFSRRRSRQGFTPVWEAGNLPGAPRAAAKEAAMRAITTDTKTLVGRLGPVAVKALERAVALTMGAGGREVTPDHVFRALLDVPDSDFVGALKAAGIARPEVAARLDWHLKRAPGGHQGKPG